jgi:hypothetical protein
MCKSSTSALYETEDFQLLLLLQVELKTKNDKLFCPTWYLMFYQACLLFYKFFAQN